MKIAAWSVQGDEKKVGSESGGEKGKGRGTRQEEEMVEKSTRGRGGKSFLDWGPAK